MRNLIKAIMYEVFAIAVSVVFVPYLGLLCYKAYYGQLSRSDVDFFKNTRASLKHDTNLSYIVQAVVLLSLILYPYKEPVSIWVYVVVLWLLWTYAITYLIHHIANRGIYEPLR